MVSENRTSMRITNGKMVEQWLAWDTPDVMQQSGAIPSQVPPTPPPRLHTEAVREGGSEPIGTNHIYIGASETTIVMGEHISVKVPGEATGGAYVVLEEVAPPGGGPSFLHTHPPQETFYVLEGEFEIYGQNQNGKYATRATPGMAIHVPGGVPHGFKNVGQTPGRLLTIFQPAGVMERFFAEIATAVGESAGPPDFGKLIQVAQKYGFRLLEALPNLSSGEALPDSKRPGEAS